MKRIRGDFNQLFFDESHEMYTLERLCPDDIAVGQRVLLFEEGEVEAEADVTEIGDSLVFFKVDIDTLRNP